MKRMFYFQQFYQNTDEKYELREDSNIIIGWESEKRSKIFTAVRFEVGS